MVPQKFDVKSAEPVSHDHCHYCQAIPEGFWTLIVYGSKGRPVKPRTKTSVECMVSCLSKRLEIESGN